MNPLGPRTDLWEVASKRQQKWDWKRRIVAVATIWKAPFELCPTWFIHVQCCKHPTASGLCSSNQIYQEFNFNMYLRTLLLYSQEFPCTVTPTTDPNSWGCADTVNGLVGAAVNPNHWAPFTEFASWNFHLSRMDQPWPCAELGYQMTQWALLHLPSRWYQYI